MFLLLGLAIGLIIVLFAHLQGHSLLAMNEIYRADSESPGFHVLYSSATKEDKSAYDAFKMLKMFAEQGETKAQFYLGKLYSDYIQDYQQAIKWYQKAAEGDENEAKYNLGLIYEDFKDNQRACMWFSQAVNEYRKVAENGDAVAQYKLGMAYNAGRGVEKDGQQALTWITKAAENGYALAQAQLGLWYGHQLLSTPAYIKSDEEKSIHWLKKAAEQNEASAEFGLSYISHFHHDTQKYVYWLHRAAEHGYALAQFELGRHYWRGDCEGIKKDSQQSMYWFRKGAGLFSDSTYALSQMYREGKGVQKNSELADYWYLRFEAITGFIHESARANVQFKLGSIYETGNDVVSQDIYQAFRWYSRAATKQHRMAQYHLGKIYMNDKYFQDTEQAIFWLKKAAEQDVSLAMQSLGIIYRDGLGVEKNNEYANQWFKEAEAATVRSNVAKRLSAFGVTSYIVGDNVNVRKRPNRSAQVVAQLSTGHPVKVTSYGVPLSNPVSIRNPNVRYKNRDWFYIKTEEEIEGWVHSQYVKPLNMGRNDQGFKEVLKRELNAFLPNTILSKKQYNELIKIFEAGSLEKLKVKMERESISPNAIFRGEDYENIDANLIAMAASYTSNVEIIKFLILESADIYRRTTGFRDLGPEMEPVTEVTVLMKASIGDRPEIVKALLDAGVDVNAKDSEKMTALDWALEYSSPMRVIKLLLEAGADAKNSLPFAFSSIAEGVTPDVLRMLIEAGAEVKGNDELLMVAANRTEYPEIIEILLDAGMNAKAKFDRGESKGERAINFARENPHLQGTKALKMLEEASYENDEERLHEEAEKKAIQQVKFQKVLRKAENGDVDAQSNLAFMYLLGSDGVVMDGKKAVYWFKKAAAQGDMGSTVQLGVIYRNGSAGVKKDDKEAEIWEQKAKKIIQERNGFKDNDSDGFQTNASITGDKVNIRTQPNTSSKVVKQLNAGHPVKATKQTNAKDGRWYFIETASGTKGWVFGKYLKLK